ncbi:hypothetical protein T11_17186 [Trichinella zimbabwensis]|uniref:Uncharacterized protein n=1 Tax=Trichinella zimbabwensis TaxID=268475 RepID=A0A0V1GTW8_9BILA|nr:hypothetical protein T11_7835 [Trichinella zimbabwensis]KRZ01675.1 hypothetical protein T11_17186 [Trichinella zimbabwensis]
MGLHASATNESAVVCSIQQLISSKDQGTTAPQFLKSGLLRISRQQHLTIDFCFPLQDVFFQNLGMQISKSVSSQPQNKRHDGNT